MAETINYKLKIPTLSDPSDITVISEAIKQIDQILYKLQSRTNVEVVYRDETGSGEANTLCFVIDEDKPDIPESPEEINAVAFDNVAFAEEAPIDGKTENYFEVSGGSEGAGVDTGKKIV
ncbi:MAG TPA: hypothetical protein H9685_08855, partial [Firmicutes bacterium]|nr:hypothetical protein [Bacillota bacterium]